MVVRSQEVDSCGYLEMLLRMKGKNNSLCQDSRCSDEVIESLTMVFYQRSQPAEVHHIRDTFCVAVVFILVCIA